MRATTYLAIGAILAPAPAYIPSVASAQSRSPADACSREITYEVQDRYPQARGVRFTSTNVSDSGRNEARVTGKGEFDDRNGGESRFSFGCTYSYRSGHAYDLDVSEVSHKSKDNTAAIAGLVLGAIVVGALVAGSKDKDRDDDWNRHEVWSPADGVRCVARERACYKNGRYSEKWTRRIFYR
ncbi:hypothetical protein [Phenylobacterium sp.]|uniref:hypothetical protein n=1 Tax=Phenylobacterium sp. TaxID=1871053 RepID=UPI0025F6813B|nr:hypothetical protein [Phenylobacterium sp.]